MNRARSISIFLQVLLSAVVCALITPAVSAQQNGQRPDPKRYERIRMNSIPPEFTRRVMKSHSRAPGDNNVLRQTNLLSWKYSLTGAPFQTNVPASSQDQHPSWSYDERYIYFDSNRTSEVNTDVPANPVFNIFRMNPDGSGVVQITTGDANKLEPAISSNNNRLAYVAGGTLSYDADLKLTTTGFKLFLLNVDAGGDAVDLTSRNPQNFTFTDVRHPSWSAGNEIAFAGKLAASPTVYHIFKVNVTTGVIAQLTSGVSNDYAPAWSQDGRLIAFTSNAAGFSANGASTALKPNDDIWVIGPSPFAANPKKVTDFTANGVASSNRNPAWSSIRVDPNGYVPGETNGGTTVSRSFLAFASTRFDSNNDGIANSVGTTTDIYFLASSIAPDPNLGGAYTDSTPETAGNPALKLMTTNAGLNPVDNTGDVGALANFDPNHTTNEDFPAWPQYQNSYRITFQSDKGLVIGKNLNLWASTILDLNAPSLLRYDQATGNIIGVFRDSNAPAVGADSAAELRELGAGDTVRFRTRVVDYETGVDTVYLQIKNPNSSTQGADGNEHKSFYKDRRGIDTTTIIPNVPIEYDCQAINPNTYSYKPDGEPGPFTQANNLARFAPLPTWPGFNKYLSGISDTLAFTGSVRDAPPDTDYWLQLYDDGPLSKGGHEPEGETAGDGVYTNKWVTPAGQPSDWYLDLIVRDKAIDPFNPAQKSNWKIYDNVWGFTTQPFSSQGTILYVNDYDIGQKFFTNRFNTGFFGGNISYTGIPTESWMTNIRQNLIPTTYITTGGGGALIGLFQTMGPHSYGDTRDYPYFGDPLTDDGSGVPVTQKYDQWRILSRGPIPDSVLNQYGARIDTQPADVTAANANAKQVTVAEKCVIWHAPYTGNVFVGNGTIADAQVQNQLTAFMANGGRVFLSGQDVAFSLSLGTPGASAFLKTNFGVDYVADFPGGIFPSSLLPNPDNVIALAGGRTIHPISTEYWIGGGDHNFYDYPQTSPRVYSPPSAGSIYTWFPDAMTPKNYGAQNNFSPDAIAFIPEVKDLAGIDGRFAGAGSPVIVWRTVKGAGSQKEQRSVYSSIAWESIHPEFYSPGTNLQASRGRRAEMIHNVGDYLRTGRIIGAIRDVNGATPIQGAFIRVTSAYSGTVGTAVSQTDGSYVITGLIPDGVYTVDGYRKGFTATHIDRVLFHGGYQSRTDLFLQKAQNGSISGRVTVNGTTPAVPVSEAIVRAYDPTDPSGRTFYEGKTKTDGTYTIDNVPTLSDPNNANTNLGYIVRIINIAALTYGGSIPTSYGTFPTDDAATKAGALAAVPVGPGEAVTGKDFKLKPSPGSLSGKVVKRDANGIVTTTPIQGATVTAISGATTLTATTDVNGNYTIPSTDPGTWQVYAIAPGFKQSDPVSVTVASGPATVVPTIALYRELPGSLSGLVTNSAGLAIRGATITLTDTAGNALKDADGNVIAAVTTTDVQTAADGYKYNYIFSSVPAGTGIKVTATKSGYTDKTGTLTVDVAKQVEKRNVNFILDPLASFTQSRQLVSAPYTYNVDIATLLGLTAAERASLRFFTYIPSSVTTGSYVKYPTPPANTFVLGRGYWLDLPNPPADLTTTGTPADTTKVFEIPLQAGWNLIGDPFTFSLNLQGLKVRDNGVEIDIATAQSGSNPALGGALWTYEVGQYQIAYSIDPFLGYWIKAYRPVTLLLDPSKRTRAAAGGRSVVSNAAGNGWTLELRAEANGTRSVPGIVGVHRAAVDSFDRFKVETPPPTGDAQEVTLTFNHSDWGTKSGRYSKDVRSMTGTNQSWEFTVQSNVAGSPINLTWPSISTIPGKNSVTLTDLDNQTSVNLRNRASYTISAGANTANPVNTRHFRLEVKREGRRKLQVSDLIAQVNQDVTRGVGSVAISYRLSSSANVQVSILQGGRKIRTLDPNRSRAEGVTQLTWDMKNDRGTSVSGNLYTVEVKATDDQGNTVRQVGTVLVTR